MHKITPLLLPELQLLKLHSKSKKLGTNFFFGDLIQSKKTSWQLAQTQKQPATQLCKKASLKIYQTSLCFFLSLRLSLSLSLSQEKAPNPNTKVPGKFPRLFSFCKFFSLKLLLVQCTWQFLTLSQWRSWWTPQASYMEGKKNPPKKHTKQNKNTNTNPRKKKRRQSWPTQQSSHNVDKLSSHPTKNGNYGVRDQLKISIKQSEDERLPPVLSRIAHSLHLQRTCSGYPRITRLLLHHSCFVFFLFQVTQILVNKTRPKKEKKHQEKKTSNQVWNFLGMDGRVWYPIEHFASDSASTKWGKQQPKKKRVKSMWKTFLGG